MPYDKQHTIRAELDSCYPKIKGNLGQQAFRSCYFNSRMSGESPAEAAAGGIAAVRAQIDAGFVPVER